MTNTFSRHILANFAAPLRRCTAATILVCAWYSTAAWGQLPNQPPIAPPGYAPPAGSPPLNPGYLPTPSRPEEIIPPAGSATPSLVADVQIRGLYMTAEHEAQKYLRTRKDREFDPNTLQNDVRALVGSNLFADVKTYTSETPQGIVVVFEVLERPRVRYIRFLGNRGLGDSTLLKQCGIKVGDSINAFLSEEGRRRMEEYYHTHGYPRAEISVLEGDQQTDKGVVYVVNEGQLQRIASVVFEGNVIASDARLKTQIESKPGYLYYFFRGKIDRAKIDADVEKLTIYYRNLGYFKAKVGKELTFDDSGAWAKLKFVIDEGPRYVIRNVSVEGAQKFDGEIVSRFLSLKQGEYFNQSAMSKDVNTILDMYGSQGHVFADIAPETRFLEEPGVLDVVYKVKEGGVFSVGEVNVKIAGEYPHTKETVVLNRLNLLPGDIIDIRKIRDAERRLSSSSLFETNPSLGDPPKVVVRPPDFEDTLVSGEPSSYTVRGQEPEQNDPRDNARAAGMPSLRSGSSIYSWSGPQSQQPATPPGPLNSSSPPVPYQPAPYPPPR